VVTGGDSLDVSGLNPALGGEEGKIALAEFTANLRAYRFGLSSGQVDVASEIGHERRNLTFTASRCGSG